MGASATNCQKIIIIIMHKIVQVTYNFMQVLWNKKIVDSFGNPTRFTDVDYLFFTRSFLFWI